jgi:hypothetical protein
MDARRACYTAVERLEARRRDRAQRRQAESWNNVANDASSRALESGGNNSAAYDYLRQLNEQSERMSSLVGALAQRPARPAPDEEDDEDSFESDVDEAHEDAEERLRDAQSYNQTEGGVAAIQEESLNAARIIQTDAARRFDAAAEDVARESSTPAAPWHSASSPSQVAMSADSTALMERQRFINESREANQKGVHAYRDEKLDDAEAFFRMAAYYSGKAGDTNNVAENERNVLLVQGWRAHKYGHHLMNCNCYPGPQGAIRHFENAKTLYQKANAAEQVREMDRQINLAREAANRQSNRR